MTEAEMERDVPGGACNRPKGHVQQPALQHPPNVLGNSAGVVGPLHTQFTPGHGGGTSQGTGPHADPRGLDPLQQACPWTQSLQQQQHPEAQRQPQSLQQPIPLSGLHQSGHQGPLLPPGSAGGSAATGQVHRRDVHAGDSWWIWRYGGPAPDPAESPEAVWHRHPNSLGVAAHLLRDSHSFQARRDGHCRSHCHISRGRIRCRSTAVVLQTSAPQS